MEEATLVRATSSSSRRRRNTSRSRVPTSRGKSRSEDEPWKLKRSVNGGPLNPELLIGFLGHVAYDVWTGKERGPLSSPNHKKLLNSWDYNYLPLGVQNLVMASGLGILHATTFDYVDMNLISAFVERWHPETNTFHMPWGEMTITLHDVFYLLGIPVNGAAVFLPDEALASVLPTTADFLNMGTDELRANTIEWRREALKFSTIKSTVTKKSGVDTREYATSYLLFLVGATLFTDKTENTINAQFLPLLQDLKGVSKLSWGSAALAFLYRQLGVASRSTCNEISGYVTLLQAWIFAYFPHFAPYVRDEWTDALPHACKWQTFEVMSNEAALLNYRRQLDGYNKTNVKWTPYRRLPAERVRISLYSGVIHCLDIEEPYMPERVLRQFGYVQNVPCPPLGCSALYLGTNIRKYCRQFDQCPSNFRRASQITIHPPYFTSKSAPGMQVVDAYMSWYIPRTHLQIHNGDGMTVQQLHDRDEAFEKTLGILSRMRPSIYPREWSSEDMTASLTELCLLWDPFMTGNE